MSDLAPLRAWLRAYPEPVESEESYQSGTTELRDGRKLHTMGFYRYGPALSSIWPALCAAGMDEADTSNFFEVEDCWLAAHGAAELLPEHLAIMDKHTMFNVLRSIEQGERFCDGTWAATYRDGFFHAGARALIALS